MWSEFILYQALYSFVLYEILSSPFGTEMGPSPAHLLGIKTNFCPFGQKHLGLLYYSGPE